MSVDLVRKQSKEKTVTEIYGSSGINLRGSEGAGTTTLTSSDKVNQVFNLSAGRTCVLPTANIEAGQKLIFENRGAFDLTFQSSDLTTFTTSNGASGSVGIPTIRIGYVEFTAVQDTPTAPSHWKINRVYEEMTLDATSGTTDYTAGSIKVVRSGRSVQIHPLVGLTHASGASVRTATALFPARLRPTIQVTVQSSGNNTVTRQITINSSGDLSSTYRNYSGTLVTTEIDTTGPTVGWTLG